MSLYKSLSNFKKNAFHVFLFGIFSFIIFFNLPSRAHAQWVVIDPANLAVNTVTASASTISAGANTVTATMEGSQFAKEFVGDSIANFIAKTIIKSLTAQTVNWINNGFKGNPAFVTNPDTFFLNVGDNVASHYLSIADGPLNQLCSPFKAQVRLALVKNYLAETSPQGSCTLGKIEQNFNNFVNDFDQGGWNSWFVVTQNSQNNPYGSYLDAKNQLSLEIGNSQDKYKKQLDWGKGILSYEKCTKTGSVAASVAPVARQCVEYAPLEVGKQSQCLKYADQQTDISNDVADDVCVEKETVTPGSVIDDQLSKALGSTWEDLGAADEINEVVSALMTQMISKVVGGIGNGLRGLTQSSPSSGSSRTLIEQMAAGSPESTAEQNKMNATINQAVPSDVCWTAADGTQQCGTAAPTPTVDVTQTPPEPAGGPSIDCTQFPSWSGCQPNQNP